MIYLINLFWVSEGKEEPFLALWEATGAIFGRSPGFLSAHLCRPLAAQPFGQQVSYTHVNVAAWEDAHQYGAALQDPELRRLVPRYAEVCTFDPALYEIVRTVPKPA